MLTLKWDFLSHWTQQLRMMLTMMFSLLVITAMNTYMWYRHGEAGSPFEESDWGVGILFIFGMFMVIAASTVLNSVRTKAQRAAYLMHPASNKEKFVSCWLYSTVGTFIIFSVAVVAADLLRMLFDLLVTQRYFGSMSLAFFSDLYEVSAGLYEELSEVLHGNAASLPVFIMMLLAPVLLHAIFLFGGVFFTKQAWLFTMGMIFIGIYVVFAADIPRLIFGFLEPLATRGEPVLVAVIWGFDAVVLLLIALTYWAAYKVFCRIQVISNKWINL